MTPKPKAQDPASSSSGAFSGRNRFRSRDGLGVYLVNPASFPSSRVIYHNKDFVAVNDRYPKSSIHTLLLPRSAKHNKLHPFEALGDPDFLSAVQKEVLKLKALVAKELRRQYGKTSQSDAKRQAILDGEAEPEGGELPPGRRWEDEVLSGIHAHPSMNHLHVHVLSRDMFSESMKHRKHYNSFNTSFLIDVADFPLAEDDPRRHPTRQGYLQKELVCWRCGKSFGEKFKALKEHLAEEFESWKRE